MDIHPISLPYVTHHVAAHRGDYYDCIENRKARLHLVTFEAGLGGLLPYGAWGGLLRRAAPTPPTTPRARRLDRSCHSTRSACPRPACVMSGARAIQKSLKRKADRRRSATTAA